MKATRWDPRMAAGEFTLITDLVLVLGAAAGGGYLASQVRQPVLLGYLVGGVIVGPGGLALLSSKSEVGTLAEIGVALLLFALGIEFSLTDLFKIRRLALGGGSLQVLLTTLLGGLLVYLTGWVESMPQAVFLGATLSLSSTAVVLKSLMERNEVQTAHGQAMLGILIFQDLSLGVMLAVLPALTLPPEAIGTALLVAFVKVAVFGAGALVAGVWVIPPLMKRIARTGSQELFILCVFALCLGVAVLTWWIGLGIAMGAFVAGLMISEIESSDHALDRVLPMRDVFATLFFASIGTLIEPVELFQNGLVVMGLVLLVMGGKALIAWPLVMALGYSPRTALTVALGINQIGEFSFVLASMGRELGLLSEQLYLLTVGTTAITLVLTPMALRVSPWVYERLEGIPSIGSWLRRSETPPEWRVAEGIRDHVVVAGYGRVGQTLARLLRSQGYLVLVLESNEATIQGLRTDGIPYLYGDASSEVVLEKANLSQAKGMAIALPDPMATRLALKRVLGIAPDLIVTVRAHNTSEIDVLYQIGATEVVQPEFEASLEMGSHMLQHLGVSGSRVQDVVTTYRGDRYHTLLPELPIYQREKELTTNLAGFNREWYLVSASSPLVGKTLVGANIRRLTGATVMEIQRGEHLLLYPDPQTELQIGDKLLVVGTPLEQKAFDHLIMGFLPLHP